MVRGVLFGISASGTYTTDIFGDALWTMLKIGVTQTDIDGISNTFVKDLAQAIFNGGYSTKYRLHTAQCFKSPDVISEEWNAPGKYYDRCGNVTGISVPIGAKIGIMVGNIPAGAQVGLLVCSWYPGHELTGKRIPAGMGVILSRETNDDIRFLYDPTVELTDVSGNDLTGTYVDVLISSQSVNGGDIFVLHAPQGVVGFYKYEGTYLHANKAFLNPSLTQYVRSGFFGFGFEGNELTGIESAAGAAEDALAGALYDLQGHRVMQPQKGNVYIARGKKIRF